MQRKLIAPAVMETHSKKMAQLRLMLVASDLAVPKDPARHAELLRLLAEELAKDRLTHYEDAA
jgi:hypothetical protein